MVRKANKQKRGGGLLTPMCQPTVDVSRYTQACGSGNKLPLDNIFQQNFADWKQPWEGQSGGAKSRRRVTKGKQHGGKHKGKQSRKSMRGGFGYSWMPEENVGNRAGFKAYSDCCPPVFTNKGSVWSNNFQPVCGQAGGKPRKQSKRSYRKSTKKSTRTRKSHRKSYRKQSGGHKRKSSSKKSRSKRYRKKGGGVKGMTNEDGNFSADMNTRTFGCRQPFWTPDCV